MAQLPVIEYASCISGDFEGVSLGIYPLTGCQKRIFGIVPRSSPEPEYLLEVDRTDLSSKEEAGPLQAVHWHLIGVVSILQK